MKRGYVVIAIVVVAAFLVSVPMLNTTKEDFSTYNTDWNGCSRVKELSARDGHETRVIFSMSEIGGSTNGVLIMLNPDKRTAMTGQDLSDLKNYVQNGGCLVLANDFGNANAVVKGLGLVRSVRFDGALLRDNVTNWADDAHPLVTNVTPSSVTSGVHTLYFNYATTLDTAGPRVTVLARSAPTSDVHTALGRNTRASGGGRPVLAHTTYGKGKVLLLSDPSVFINGMVDKGDNEKLFTNVIANFTADAAGPVMFDESQRASHPVWSLAYDRVNADDTIKYGVALCSMAVVVIGMHLLARRRRQPERVKLGDVSVDEAIVLDDIVRTHPGWQRAQLKGLLRHLQRERRTKRDNRK